MNICIPVETNDKLTSKVFGHFGSAPYFIIYNTEKDGIESLKNSNAHHAHGMCQPLNALAGKKIEAVVCVSMGARAVGKLNKAGIRAYRANAQTVEELIGHYKNNALEEITPKTACDHHDCHEQKETR